VLRIEAGEYIDDAALPQLQSDAVMTRLGREFLTAAERGDAMAVGAFLEEGFPANWQDNRTKETALHVAAASQARGVLRVLLDAGQCDYLLRDKGGRLASDLAYLYGHDPAAARLLGVKERKQAETHGITLTSKSRE
jgi:ankyrin repeat protein